MQLYVKVVTQRRTETEHPSLGLNNDILLKTQWEVLIEERAFIREGFQEVHLFVTGFTFFSLCQNYKPFKTYNFKLNLIS